MRETNMDVTGKSRTLKELLSIQVDEDRAVKVT
jgi:hypothetical protein